MTTKISNFEAAKFFDFDIETTSFILFLELPPKNLDSTELVVNAVFTELTSGNNITEKLEQTTLSPNSENEKVLKKWQIKEYPENIFDNVKDDKKQEDKIRKKNLKVALDKVEWKEGNFVMRGQLSSKIVKS